MARARFHNNPPPPPRGCDIAGYAELLAVPETYLEDWDITDTDEYGRSVRIPYFDDAGSEIAAHYRIAIDGSDKFRVKKNQHPALFGINRIAEARRIGDEITIVVGESDCIVMWYEGFPAVGLTTPTSWDEAKHAGLFYGLNKIFVVLSPKKGDAAILKWMRESSIRDRVFLVTLPDDKDPAALHFENADEFWEVIDKALNRAVPWHKYAERNENEIFEAARRGAGDLLTNRDILEEVADECHALGIAGERRIVKLAYLVATTRLFAKPVSLIIKGPSSVGKSFLLGTVLRLFPDEAFYDFSAMSDKSLIHTNESLVHRMLVIYEAAGLKAGFQAMIVRSLLSEGHIKYSLPSGPKIVPGPTGLLCTTTADALHHENETRCLSVAADESPEQTGDVIRLKALMRDNEQREIDPKWHALQHYLQVNSHRVRVPYERRLTDLIKPKAVRFRRDFDVLYTLIRAHALLHQETRKLDGRGAIVATIEDYRVVRQLVNDILSEGAETLVPELIRETVQAVDDLIQKRAGSVTQTELAEELSVTKSTALRRAETAIAAGYLRNLEPRRARPARLVLANELPTDNGLLLPKPEVLERSDDDPRG